MPRRKKLTETHRVKISQSMKAYHRKVKQCLAKEQAKKRKHKAKPKPKPRRVQPTLVSTPSAKAQLPSTLSKGQQTTVDRLGQLEQRVTRERGKDLSPWLGF